MVSLVLLSCLLGVISYLWQDLPHIWSQAFPAPILSSLYLWCLLLTGLSQCRKTLALCHDQLHRWCDVFLIKFASSVKVMLCHCYHVVDMSYSVKVMMFCFLFLPVVSGLHPFFFSCIDTLTACRPGSQMKSIQAVNQNKVQKQQIAKKGKLNRVHIKELEKLNICLRKCLNMPLDPCKKSNDKLRHGSGTRFVLQSNELAMTVERDFTPPRPMPMM